MAVSIKLDEELKERLQRLAEQHQRSSHWMMREAIRSYVEREEARDRFTQEALVAWQAYRETGLHLSAGEVNEWLDRWGSDDESEIPECHS